MKLGQKEILLKYLAEKAEWIPEYSVTKLNTSYGWLGSSADRVARKLAEEGRIDRKMVGKFCYIRSKLTISQERLI